MLFDLLIIGPNSHLSRLVRARPAVAGWFM
jgi:hypothetical protein